MKPLNSRQIAALELCAERAPVGSILGLSVEALAVKGHKRQTVNALLTRGLVAFVSSHRFVITTREGVDKLRELRGRQLQPAAETSPRPLNEGAPMEPTRPAPPDRETEVRLAGLYDKRGFFRPIEGLDNPIPGPREMARLTADADASGLVRELADGLRYGRTVFHVREPSHVREKALHFLEAKGWEVREKILRYFDGNTVFLAVVWTLENTAAVVVDDDEIDEDLECDGM